MDSTRFRMDEDLYMAVHRHAKMNATDPESTQCTLTAIQSALHTVHSAIADFAEERNNTASSLLRCLPNELLAEGFKWLSFCDRITASQVSRAWRGAALGTPTLWATIYIPSTITTASKAVSRLRNMILRSGGAPLDVDWDTYRVARYMLSPALESELRTLFRDSMSRIRTLTLNDALDLDFLTTLDAPLLESLRLPVARSAFGVPTQWIRDRAPRLRTLRMGLLAPPAFPAAVSRSIERFTGTLQPDDYSVAREIFVWFPCLASLEFNGVHSGDQLPPLSMAPPTLVKVDIAAARRVDFYATLLNWTTSPVGGKKRKFIFYSNDRPAFEYALHYLATAYLTVEMRFIDIRHIYFATPGLSDLDVYLTSSLVPSFHAPSELCGNPHLSVIVSLVLSEDAVMSILRANLNLPALRSLTISASPLCSPANPLDQALSRHPPALSAPSLRDLTFALTAFEPLSWADFDIPRTACRLADFVAAFIKFGERTLDSITIIESKPVARDDICGLLVYSSLIYYKKSARRVPKTLFDTGTTEQRQALQGFTSVP